MVTCGAFLGAFLHVGCLSYTRRRHRRWAAVLTVKPVADTVPEDVHSEPICRPTLQLLRVLKEYDLTARITIDKIC